MWSGPFEMYSWNNGLFQNGATCAAGPSRTIRGVLYTQRSCPCDDVSPRTCGRCAPHTSPFVPHQRLVITQGGRSSRAAGTCFLEAHSGTAAH